MDIFVNLSRFLHRIRYKLLIGSFFSALLAIYLSSFLPKLYNVSTTIFTGITSKVSVDEAGSRTDWVAANNAHENIINIVKSKSTLENVSLKLLAQHLIYGDEHNDNKYIMAANYRNIAKIIPDRVKELVDKRSLDNTVKNFLNYRREEKGNFFYDVFNWDNKYYGYLSLSKIQMIRKGASDMLEISYQCDDPGIATNTVSFLNDELSSRYETLLLSASNDVVTHFEEQLNVARRKLEESEDMLVRFNVENRIINYEEQTKHLAALNNIIESRYGEVLLNYNSSKILMDKLEIQMETRSKLILENEIFIQSLSSISTLNGKIAEIEIFDTDYANNRNLLKYKDELKKAEQEIKDVTDRMEQYKFSKEGVAIPQMVNEWLSALLLYEKSKSELEVMNKRKAEIEKLYDQYSPVGPNLGKQTRNVKVEEEAYLTILHHLGLAKLKQKNILLDAGTLQVVTAPTIPLLVVPRKRKLFVVAAFLGSVIFIIGLNLLIEMIDRTLRDKSRTERLTTGKVLGAFPGNKKVRHRRFNKEVLQLSTGLLGSVLNRYIEPGKPMIVNLLSVQKGEGKTFLAEKLLEYWSERGFNVVHVLGQSEEIDQESRGFQLAERLADLPGMNAKIGSADIILSEYAPLDKNNVPNTLLKEASLNLLILNAERAWLPNDKEVYEDIKTAVGAENLQLYLNFASREAVEEFTGLLPPYTFSRKLVYRLMYFGLTSKA